MQTSYAQAYERLYEQHWWWRAREAFVVAALEQHVRGHGGNVLDVGCGNGLFFPVLRRFGCVEGIEADARLVPSCRHPHGTIHIASFDPSFQPGKTYRLIVMLDVLEHLPDAAAALQHAVSLLDPDGTLLITVPAFRLLWTAHDDLNRHFTRYTEASFRELAQCSGMRLDELRYFYHWLFPLKVAVRVKEACLPGKPQPPQIPAGPVNRLLYGVSRLEQRLCGRHALPFGSSLLAVGGRRQPAGPKRMRCRSAELASVTGVEGGETAATVS
jgi:trans-aconitate methyltransferase